MRRIHGSEDNEWWVQQLMKFGKSFSSNNAFHQSAVALNDQFQDAIRALDFPSMNEHHILKWVQFV